MPQEPAWPSRSLHAHSPCSWNLLWQEASAGAHGVDCCNLLVLLEWLPIKIMFLVCRVFLPQVEDISCLFTSLPGVECTLFLLANIGAINIFIKKQES